MLQGHIDKYKLIEIKGSGTFGTVWLAEDTWIGKKVALKIPHNQKENFTTLVAEPKLLASLDHPNIVQLLTVDKAENIFFMVMEYVDGNNLAQLMKDTSLTIREIREILIQILSALNYAHEKNIIHRDLKPGNILLTSDRKVKITDFGTATLVQSNQHGSGIGGTLYYMSKEQVLGHPVPVSDLYSLGVILYEIVTGQLPFFDEVPMVVLNKILKDDPIEPRILRPNIPAEIQTIILKALQKDPAKRFQSALEMRQMLEAVPEKYFDQIISSENKTTFNAMNQTLVHVEKQEVIKEVGDINTLRYRGFHYKLIRTFGSRGKDESNFMSPVSISVDAQKRIYVVDSLKCQILVFDNEGKYLYSIGKFGKETETQEAVFLMPVSVALDAAGNLIVLDSKSCTVQIIEKNGKVLTKFGETASPNMGKIEVGFGGFFHPQALALDKKENVYVSDTGNHRIRVFNTAGRAINKFGNQGTRFGEFNNPVGLCINTESNILVVDEHNFRIQIFNQKGVFKYKFGKRGTGNSEFSSPFGIATDSKNNIFVTDRNLRVQIFDPDGYFLTDFGTPPGNYKIAPRYYSIYIDNENTVYLTDIANFSISIFGLKK
jgi:serine/threonine-protein kinase